MFNSFNEMRKLRNGIKGLKVLKELKGRVRKIMMTKLTMMMIIKIKHVLITHSSSTMQDNRRRQSVDSSKWLDLTPFHMTISILDLSSRYIALGKFLSNTWLTAYSLTIYVQKGWCCYSSYVTLSVTWTRNKVKLESKLESLKFMPLLHA